VSAHEDLSRQQRKLASDRSFGLVFTAVFALLGLWPLLHGNPVRVWALGTSGALLLAALLVPSVLHVPNLLWARLAVLLEKVVNPLVMGVLFYVVIAPSGFILRRLGKDLLRLRADPQASTYWIERKPPGPAPETMSQQF
jgi:hypothetical protein